MQTKNTALILFLLVAVALGTSTSNAYAQVPAPATPDLVEAQVREYFADIPVMIKIARCESKFRQFTDAGNVLRGGYNGGMIGVFQFYERVHSSRAQTLGYDLATVDGNLAYARHLYDQSGTQPWNSSRACFKTTRPPAPLPPATAQTIELTDAQLLEKIALLEQLISLLKTLLALQQK